MTIWQVWAGIKTASARRYLQNLAAYPEKRNIDLMRMAGLNGRSDNAQKTLLEWRDRFPGFYELEHKLHDEPATAAHFLTAILLPKSLIVYAEMLETGEGTQKRLAAKTIINMSTPAFRADTKEQTKEPPRSTLDALLEEAE